MASSGRYDAFAITAPGLESIAAGELTALGMHPGDIETGGVSFSASAAELYRANYQLRTVSRVVVRLAEFPARAFYELERKAKRIPWGEVLAPGGTVRFRVTSRKSRLYHLNGIAERLALAAGAEPAPAQLGVLPDDLDPDETASPAQLFVVRVVRDVVSISADSSGELLHRRGYRQATAKAPLRETLAAAILLGAGYDGSMPLLDPFCGAGTIPIEAALLARRIAPGKLRSFAFEGWPGFDARVWAAVRADAEALERVRVPSPILGSDRDAGAIAAASANAARAGVAADIAWREAAISAIDPPAGPGLVATNPPYGIRVGSQTGLRDLYAALGTVLRSRCPGWSLALLSADPALEGQVGLSLAPAWVSTNGGLPIRLVRGQIPG